jgi:hypothetical protein
MRKNSYLALAPVIVVALCAQTALTQIRIEIPRLPGVPKVEKPKREQPNPEQPKTESSRSAARQPTTAPDEQPARAASSGSKLIYENQYPTSTPVFVKDSLYVQANTHKEYWKFPNQKNYSSWVPTVRFSVFFNLDHKLNYTAEYFNPDGTLWFSEPLKPGLQADDRTLDLNSDRSQSEKLLATKSSAGVGTYGLKITNKDTGEVVFQGKFKVGKFLPPYSEKTEFDFFVEHDWLLPVGYVGFHYSGFEIGGFPPVVQMWFKNNLPSSDHGLEARLFYKGQQIATTANKGGTVVQEAERASEFAALSPQLHHWRLWSFQWWNFRYDNNGSFNHDSYPNAFYADKNPGEYTVKVFHKDVEVREAKFSVGADGRLVDGGYYKPGFLTYHKVIIPVKVVGAAEKWNPLAWKTDAFYGNPLNAFHVQ